MQSLLCDVLHCGAVNKRKLVFALEVAWGSFVPGACVIRGRILWCSYILDRGWGVGV